jgi:hypothetical protein
MSASYQLMDHLLERLILVETARFWPLQVKQYITFLVFSLPQADFALGYLGTSFCDKQLCSNSRASSWGRSCNHLLLGHRPWRATTSSHIGQVDASYFRHTASLQIGQGRDSEWKSEANVHGWWQWKRKSSYW